MLTPSLTLHIFGSRYHRRTPAKDFYGHAAARCRTATIVERPEYTTLIPTGVYRQWRELQVGLRRLVYLVGRHLSVWAPAVSNPRPYMVSSTTQPVPAELGNRFIVRYIPVGAVVSNLGYFARAAGTSIKLLRHREERVEVRLPSKKQIWVEDHHAATIGANPNPEAKHLKLTKAGHSFMMGRRPTVRGVAMNPVDHPNGGGQGKTSGGGPSTSSWGQLSKGYKTVLRRGA